jgi:glycosyltransferase involved in cell wall biosynthesis
MYIMDKKKILFVEQNMDGTIGGSHYCLLYLIQRLNRDAFEPVTVFHESNQLVDLFSREGATFVMDKFRLSTFKISPVRKILNLILSIRTVARCYLFLKKHKIDLIHLNNSVAGGYDTWLPAALLAKIPCITHDRTYFRFDKLNLKFFHVLSRRFAKVLTVSDVIRNNLIDQGFNPEQVETVYDGIDAAAYRNRVKKTRADIADEFKIGPDDYIIGLVGNIREWKGQELLIDSLNILQKNIPNFKCLLVGDVAKNSDEDTRFKERLIKKIDAYGLAGKVIFTGYRSDVPDIVNALDVQINSSIEPDPFPHVILEGMSLGKVVIATNLGGAVESIKDGETGFLVSAKDPSDLSEKIKLVLTDKPLRETMSRKARERVENFLSLEKNIKHTEDIYYSILRKG